MKFSGHFSEISRKFPGNVRGPGSGFGGPGGGFFSTGSSSGLPLLLPVLKPPPGPPKTLPGPRKLPPGQLETSRDNWKRVYCMSGLSGNQAEKAETA